jgi:hypothetical protein
VDAAFGEAAAEYARLHRASGVPLHASWLPPREYAALAEHHARSRQQAHALMAAHTRKEGLHATGLMAQSAEQHARGVRASASKRLAHAHYAGYQACAAVAAPEEHSDDAILRALHDHRHTPLDQRDAMWYAVEAARLDPAL